MQLGHQRDTHSTSSHNIARFKSRVETREWNEIVVVQTKEQIKNTNQYEWQNS